MIIYSPFFKSVFWILIGLIYALIITGAPIWAQDLGLQLSWWKWVFSGLWYVLLSFTFAGAFTLFAEREPGAWYKFLGFHLIIAIVSGMVLCYMIKAIALFQDIKGLAN